MEMCLLLFKTAQPLTMQTIANLDIELITQLWMPVEFVGDYITQRLCLKLIVAVLKHLSVEQTQTKVSEANLDQDIKHWILKLSEDPTNFEEVSRELLNAYNMTLSRTCTVFSIYCTKAMFGNSELFKPDKVTNFWIDFNYTSQSVSLLCQLNQSEGKQEEFYIKIKINKLQIENQFDCSVYTIEQASFSTNVSAQLLSSRVAVFTLPENQLEMLKANNDLIDYYNTFSYTESSEVSTPNTITKYLADLSTDSPATPYYEQSCDIPRLKLARVKLRKCDAAQKYSRKDSTKSKKRNFKFEINPTANSKSLVTRVEHLPNYVGPSNKGSGYNTSVNTNTTTTEDTSIFKKPKIPIKCKTKKKAQAISGKMKKIPKTSEKPSVKPVNKPQREVINSSNSNNKTDITHLNTTEQKKSSPMPTFKSEKDILQTEQRNSSKLTRDEVSFAYTSIQVSTNSFQRFSNTTKQQNFQEIKQSLIEENSLLEISLQEMSNTSRSTPNNSNMEKIIRKSINTNNFALLPHESSENVLQQLETPENPTVSTPIQASVIPIQRSPKVAKSSQPSQLKDQNPLSEKFDSNLSPIINQNYSQFRDSENHVTSSQTSNDESQSFSQNISPSRIVSKQIETSQSLNCDGVQNKTSSLEGIASELPKDKGRRFFKHKNLPTIYSTPAPKSKRKTRKKNSNITESQQKTKSVNLVKPLNYVTEPSLNTIEPIVESKNTQKSIQMKNDVSNKHKSAAFSNQKNETIHDVNVISDSDQDIIPKPTKRRTSKRKTLLKDVEVANFVPYSVWKMNQKDKNHRDPIILSPKPKLQKEITSEIEYSQPSKDPFDNIKRFGIKNDIFCDQTIIPRRRRRSSSSSDSIRTLYFSESEDEMNSAQGPCPKRKKLQKRDIIRHKQPDEMILSPIRVPFDIVERRSKSPSGESNLSSVQMSLDSDCLGFLNSSPHPNESHQRLENKTKSIQSPVYEDLDDEVPEDPLQIPNVNNLPTKDHHNEAAKHSSDSEEENQELPISPDIRPSLEPQQPHIHLNKSAESESNQIVIRDHNVVAPLGKRTHSAENRESSLAKIPALTQGPPLRDYDRILPNFIKKLTAKKDRLLDSINTKFSEDIFETVDAVTKLIDYHHTAIKEKQEKLLSILENMEWHQKNLEKNQSELEKIYNQVVDRTQTCDHKTDKIDQMYKEAEEDLISYAEVVKREEWHNFCKSIVNSVNKRLEGYLNI